MKSFKFYFKNIFRKLNLNNNSTNNFNDYLNKYVYEPAEDSQLMIDAIKSFIKSQSNITKNNKKYNSKTKELLEIGGGSGFVSANIQEHFKKTTITDINPYAINYLKNKFNNSNNKTNNKNKNNNKDIIIKKSYLFNNIHKKYDLIVFNPPYLPSDPLDIDDWLNKSLVGGKKGNEIILEFIEKLPCFMKQNSTSLLLFSSLSSPKEIFESLEKKALIYSKINEISFDFETIYVYKINKSKIYNYSKKVDLFSHGKKGNIYKAKKLAIKKNRRNDMFGNIKMEFNVLNDLKKENYLPKVIDFKTDYDNNDFFVYKFIKGETLESFLKQKQNKKRILKIIKSIILATNKLDKKNIWKKEFNHPYKNIIIKYPKAYLIDFERASYSHKTNMNQLLSFLKGTNMSEIYKKYNISLNIKKIENIEKTYRDNKNQVSEIISCFK